MRWLARLRAAVPAHRVNYFVHAGNSLAVVASLSDDMVQLRSFMIGATTCGMCYNLLQPTSNADLPQREAEISGFEALGRANFDGGVPYGSDPLAQWRQQGCDYRTHMHADYERAASRQVAALAGTAAEFYDVAVDGEGLVVS